MLFAMGVLSVACAATPAVLTLLNLREYLSPPVPTGTDLPKVAVLIPARDEEQGIAACLASILGSRGVGLEVIVLDDGSTDQTASIVAEIAARDSRVKLVPSAALPMGWNGKQHACWQAAQMSSAQLLCFLDADVRLQPDALVRSSAVLPRENATLVSGFPRELTGTWLEKLLLPLIHFVLLGLLPLRLLRTTTEPGFAAGCGQFMLVDRQAYFQSGGHAAIRHTMHDGLLLPRIFRQHGFATRLIDLTRFAECRMYRSAAATWNGLAKNATEGLAAPTRILPFTLLLGLGQVLPLLLLYLAWQRTTLIVPFLGPPFRTGMPLVRIVVAAVVLSYLPRVVNAVRYRQSWASVALHPLGVAVLLVLQWYALLRKLLGRTAVWKSRDYAAN